MGSGDNRIAGFCVELHLVRRTRTVGARQPMSALGQKQTWRQVSVTSALPRKRTFAGAVGIVSLVPLGTVTLSH